MVEMQDAWFCNSGSTLKPWRSTSTAASAPLVESPSWLIHDRNGYSLPANQTPSVWPAKSVGAAIPLSARQVSIMPDRLKNWATLTNGTPRSRAARAAGIHSMMTSAPPAAITCGGAMSGPPGWIVTSSPASS